MNWHRAWVPMMLSGQCAALTAGFSWQVFHQPMVIQLLAMYAGAMVVSALWAKSLKPSRSARQDIKREQRP